MIVNEWQVGMYTWMDGENNFVNGMDGDHGLRYFSADTPMGLTYTCCYQPHMFTTKALNAKSPSTQVPLDKHDCNAREKHLVKTVSPFVNSPFDRIRSREHSLHYCSFCHPHHDHIRALPPASIRRG